MDQHTKKRKIEESTKQNSNADVDADVNVNVNVNDMIVKIESIDKDIVQLLNDRAKVSINIGRSKKLLNPR